METPETMQKAITSLSQLDLEGVYSYADYLLWRFEERVELIKGQIFKMSPAPTFKHQKISIALLGTLIPHFRKTPCELISAPFDVRLLDKTKSSRANQDVYTVVQPDLCVICDRNKIDAQGCIGAPDLIVEILSPGNSKKEMQIKYALYEECGVREYWIVFPSEHVLQQFVLSGAGRYELMGSFAEDGMFTAHIFPDLQIDLAEVFAE
jgi:Uma2 family endonuclease